jgi:hypothetical protein
MKFLPAILILFIGLIFFPANTVGQSTIPDIENTDISILTCRSGDELYSTFGHTAIRIVNTENDFDITYNYGVYSYNTSNFYIKFMRGKLPYYLGVSQTEFFMREYYHDKRSVIEQKLILTNDQKEIIIRFLLENAKPENRSYKYDFFYDNCATRAVDVYELAGEINYSNSIDEKTYRELLKENLQNLVWSDFGIDLVIGARADLYTDRRGQMFLPEYIMKNLEYATVNSSGPLVEQAKLVLDFEELNAARKKSGTNWPLICTSILFILSLLINLFWKKIARTYNRLIILICGILGLFLLFMWFGTEHGATKDNWNILWLNPLFLIFPFIKGKTKRISIYIIIVILFVAGLNCIIDILPQFYNLGFLPLIMMLALIFYIEYQRVTRNSKIA